MTNLEVIIHDLSHFKADNEGTWGIVDYIECPYVRDADCKNSETDFKLGSIEFEELCRECKAEWLAKEWDE